MEINKREFQRHVGKYIKEGIYKVEVSDSAVIIECLSDNNMSDSSRIVSDKPRKRQTGYHMQHRIIKKKEDVKEAVRELVTNEMRYGCGCEKVSGKNLCPKHGRV